MTELTLAGKSPLARVLHVTLSRGHRLYASIQKPQCRVQLAYACAEIADCYLHQSDRWSLWMGCAAFDVSDAECERIQATFPQISVKKAEPAISPIEGIA